MGPCDESRTDYPSERAPLRLGSSLVAKVRAGDASSVCGFMIKAPRPSEIKGRRPSELPIFVFAASFGVLSEYVKTSVQQFYYIDRKI